jgi:hypothetical protein
MTRWAVALSSSPLASVLVIEYSTRGVSRSSGGVPG